MSMIKVFVLSIFLISCHNVRVLASTDLATAQDDANGPVSHMMENLSLHTSTVTSELLAQLAAKIERLAKALVGKMEIVVTSALKQLAQPFEDARKKLNSAQCQMAVSFEVLKERVNSDLSTCTQKLNVILHTFEADAHEFNAALQQNVKEIIELPKECQSALNETEFGSDVSCYIAKIAAINQQIAIVLNSASSTLVHTRQLGDQAMETARNCADNVVVSTVDYLVKILDNCQPIDN